MKRRFFGLLAAVGLAVLAVFPAAAAGITPQAISVMGSVVNQTCVNGDIVRITLTATANSTSQPVRFTWDLNNDGRPDTALSTNPAAQTFWVDESVKTVRVYAVNAAGEVAANRVQIFTRRCA